MTATTEAERVYGLLAGELQRRFTYKAQDGHEQTVSFTSANVTSDGAYLLLELDTRRIPKRYTVGDLDSPEILHHLGSVVGHPVQKLNTTGLTYAVRLTPKERRAQLPTRWELDASTRPAGSLLWIPLGMGHNGTHWAQLPTLGHVLVSGCTGSGKSTWLQAALCALLATESPTALQVGLIDAKTVELAPWRNAPHVIGFASNGAAATELAERVLQMCEDRAALLEAGLHRSIDAYNKRASEPLPYILVIVDELFDCVAEGGDRLSQALARITSKGRALGVYLWASCQYPRWDTLDRRMSVNMASRLTFRVVDSKAALLSGCPGAERIPIDRPGRYMAAIGGQRVTLQAPYIADRTLRGVIHSLGAPTSRPALPEDEQRLASLILEQLEGVFVVNTVYELTGPQSAGGFSRRWLKDTATAWERRGYLSTDNTDPMHPRRIATDALRNAAGTRGNT